MEAITVAFFSSKFLRYFSLSSNALNCSSFNSPVTGFLYLAINGIVFPSSISFTAASTCHSFTPSSSAITSFKFIRFPPITSSLTFRFLDVILFCNMCLTGNISILTDFFILCETKFSEQKVTYEQNKKRAS